MHGLLVRALVLATSFSSLGSACIYKRDAASANWSYTGETGPLLWHRLNNTNSACAAGKDQSPINVNTDIVRGNVTLEYPEVGEFLIENNGHTIELTPTDPSKYVAKIGDSDYQLLQFHFHTPSEHRLNNEYFPLEVHFVHQHVETLELRVMGVFFDVSPWFSDPFLLGVDLNDVTTVSKETDEHHTNILLSSITKLTQRSPIYTYAGSLTTPPCSEAVTWFVVETPIDVSVSQYKQFKRIMRFNSRFTQNDLHMPVTDNLIADACEI